MTFWSESQKLRNASDQAKYLTFLCQLIIIDCYFNLEKLDNNNSDFLNKICNFPTHHHVFNATKKKKVWMEKLQPRRSLGIHRTTNIWTFFFSSDRSSVQHIAPQLMVFSPYFWKIIYFLVILSSDDYCIISIYLFRVKKHELV